MGGELVGALVAVQLLMHPQGRDPYTGWGRDRGIDCCGGRDCAPAALCVVDGKEGWLEEGKCRPLPPERELPLPSVEAWQLGELHVCRVWENGEPKVLCWALARGT